MSKAHYLRIDPMNWEGAEVELCMAYWNELRGERIAPSWKEFRWSRIPVNIISFFEVVDISLSPVAMTYRFYGTAHTEALGLDLTGRSPLEMDPLDIGQSTFRQFAEVAWAREPALYLHILHDGKGDTNINETSLRLPFSNDGEKISQIAAFTDLRENFILARQHFVYNQKLSSPLN